ncbi:MAG TPA: tetratricopeptide repeat protein [Thermoanaerobaculia bacterium]|nr:tetratricopeptide repeat protein [Thermoanaerobaculia bacterium]
MKHFVEAHVDRRANAEQKLHQLIGAIINSKSFGVMYEPRTRTASDTFADRRGNCLSFSTMFIAMARDVGLEVQYQEVEIPPQWTLDANTFVLNQHINVRVDLGLRGKRVVDFNMAEFRANYDMRTISDRRGLAHFYNNLGVERMQAGDRPSALAAFETAIGSGDRHYTPAWTNLGTLHLRAGDVAGAEAAYLQALRTNQGDLVAMSNLERLYQSMGDRRRAVAYHAKVIRHRNRNPYYRYELAGRAFAAQQYDKAISHLQYAIRTGKRDERFYLLLARTYLEKGDRRRAAQWIRRLPPSGRGQSKQAR